MKKGTMILAACLMLSGCASPLVVYDKISGPDRDGKTKFQLAETLVKFDFPVEGTGLSSAPNKEKLTATAVPVPDSSETYSISGTGWSDNWFVTTDINVTHTGDSLLLKQVGSKITDQRVAAIGAVASIATDALVMFAARADAAVPPVSTEETKLPPTGLLVSDFLDKFAADPAKCAVSGPVSGHVPRDSALSCKSFKLDGGMQHLFKLDKDGKPAMDGNQHEFKREDGSYYADITIGAVPADAFQESKWPFESSALIYAACRTMNITVTNAALGSTWKVQASLVVADSHWLQSMKLPPNGKVVLGDSCGADSTADSYTASTSLDYLKAAGDAAKTIKDSLKSSGSTGAKK